MSNPRVGWSEAGEGAPSRVRCVSFPNFAAVESASEDFLTVGGEAQGFETRAASCLVRKKDLCVFHAEHAKHTSD